MVQHTRQHIAIETEIITDPVIVSEVIVVIAQTSTRD
jgi:hypothetical protein